MEKYEVPPHAEVTAPHIDELLRALQEASTHNEEEGATVRELMECTGWPLKRVRERLRAIKKEGRLEYVRVYRENIMGSMSSVPAYRLKNATG